MKVYIVFDAQDDGFTFASEEVVAVFSSEIKAQDYIIKRQADESPDGPVHLMYRMYTLDEGW